MIAHKPRGRTWTVSFLIKIKIGIVNTEFPLVNIFPLYKPKFLLMGRIKYEDTVFSKKTVYDSWSDFKRSHHVVVVTIIFWKYSETKDFFTLQTKTLVSPTKQIKYLFSLQEAY